MSKIYWTDFHTNIHSKHIDNIEQWYQFAREMIDFWSPCYYPYFVRHLESKLHVEDQLDNKQMVDDFEKIRQFCIQKEQTDKYISFLSYEWQGNGADGDHNVFFRSYKQNMQMPLCYKQLAKSVDIADTIAIPHHPGYMPHYRGKNWKTHIPELSPIAEIYSSHGSSESDECFIPLNVHIHMGPRTHGGTIKSGLNDYQHKFGLICSGDNHTAPAISGNGLMAVIADNYERNTIFDAIKNRHVYGVTRSKMALEYTINNTQMGAECQVAKQYDAKVAVVGTNAIDRIEFIQNGKVSHVYSHISNEKLENKTKLHIKFEVEFGWGPDTRIFPDIDEKHWDVNLKTDATILSVEKLYTSPGCQVHKNDTKQFVASVVSYKQNGDNGKLSQKNYMTPYIQNQSYIFEVEGTSDDLIYLEVDGVKYEYSLLEIASCSHLEANLEQTAQLLKDRFDFTEYYRTDPFWHNAYKIKIHKGATINQYQVAINHQLKATTKCDNIYVKVHQKNGDICYSSPIWIYKS